MDNDQLELQVEQERTRRAQLRSENIRLLVSREGLLLALWVVLGTVASFVAGFAPDDAVRGMLSSIGALGFIGTLMVLGRVK